MTDLSPAAQAVLDAYENTYIDSGLVAAIFELTDQVVPEESEPSEQPFADLNDRWPIWNANQKTRRKILAIATELEGQ
jgi:hypothetical protein